MALQVATGLAIVFSVIAASNAADCGGALPSTIRVQAFPDAWFKVGSPNFLVDLLDAIEAKTNIPYTITPRPGFSFGNQQFDGSFNGSLVGELIANNADLVGADLTITPVREAVVDFLVPFTSYQLVTLTNINHVAGAPIAYVSMDNGDLRALPDAGFPEVYENVEGGRPGSIVATDAEGASKAASSTGNFAYIIDSPAVPAALAAHPGKLKQAPGSFGTYFLALAVQQGSPLREKLNNAIVQLSATGAVQKLLVKHGFAS